ncbi:hypothetical protein P7M35_24255 [Vibrio parahaemolyticus]|nr:hypothetical protein [Vibrio parahaemolyticus]
MTLDNGGKFAYPVMNTQVTLDNPHNYSSGSFSARSGRDVYLAYRIEFCAIVAFEKGDFAEMENFSYHQVRLMELAREYSEWDNVARVID